MSVIGLRNSTWKRLLKKQHTSILINNWTKIFIKWHNIEFCHKKIEEKKIVLWYNKNFKDPVIGEIVVWNYRRWHKVLEIKLEKLDSKFINLNYKLNKFAHVN